MVRYALILFLALFVLLGSSQAYANDGEKKTHTRRHLKKLDKPETTPDEEKKSDGPKKERRPHGHRHRHKGQTPIR